MKRIILATDMHKHICNKDGEEDEGVVRLWRLDERQQMETRGSRAETCQNESRIPSEVGGVKTFIWRGVLEGILCIFHANGVILIDN